MLIRSIRVHTVNRSARWLQPAVARSFHVSPQSRALSEQDHHKDEKDRKAEIEEHKQDTLNKQKNGSGQWKRELASNSEAAVKADREEIEASEKNIRKMQEETSKAASQQRR